MPASATRPDAVTAALVEPILCCSTATQNANLPMGADALITGLAFRDIMMHHVLMTSQFPEIHFTLDSLVDLTKHGDTLFGGAMGALTVRGVQQRTTAVVKAFPEAGGMRVLAKLRVPAALLRDLTPRLHYLGGLGLNAKLWLDFFMGADLVFRPETRAAN